MMPDDVLDYQKKLDAAVEALKPKVLGKTLMAIDIEAAYIVYGAILIAFGHSEETLHLLSKISRAMKLKTVQLGDHN